MPQRGVTRKFGAADDIIVYGLLFVRRGDFKDEQFDIVRFGDQPVVFIFSDESKLLCAERMRFPVHLGNFHFSGYQVGDLDIDVHVVFHGKGAGIKSFDVAFGNKDGTEIHLLSAEGDAHIFIITPFFRLVNPYLFIFGMNYNSKNDFNLPGGIDLMKKVWYK